MNNTKFERVITIKATSEKEYEALYKYKEAKKDNKSYKFEFNIGRNNEVKVAVTEYIK
jgi:hypothetical protein